MRIRVDIREHDLLELLNTMNNISALTVKPASMPVPTHTIKLSDDMTMEVPIPTHILKSTVVKTTKRSDKGDPVVVGITAPHTILPQRLSVGDIILTDSSNEEDIVIMERKSLNDLAASIRDGRYNEQSFRLSQYPHHNHNIIYIIEGDLSKYNEHRGGITKKALNSAMMSIQYYKGFSIIRTMNIHETATFIYDFADKYDKEKKPGFYSNKANNSDDSAVPATALPLNDIRASNAPTSYCEVLKVKKEKSDNITPDNIGEIMLCNIPGISAKIAIAIMRKYKTIGDFLQDLETNARHAMMKKGCQGSDSEYISPLHLESKCISGCFSDIYTETESGQRRKIGPATIDKVFQYLVLPKLEERRCSPTFPENVVVPFS
jgi:ERCC4-type nuclease